MLRCKRRTATTFMKYIGVKLKNGREYPIYTNLGCPNWNGQKMNVYRDDSKMLKEHYDFAVKCFGSRKGVDYIKPKKVTKGGRIFIAKYNPNDQNCPKLVDENVKFQIDGEALRLPIHPIKFDNGNKD